MQRYNVCLELVDNLTANAMVIKLENKYIIFINKNIPIYFIELVLFHEIGHLKFNTISNNPTTIRNVYENISNIYALFKLRKLIPFIKKIKLIYYLLCYSESKMYEFFANECKYYFEKKMSMEEYIWNLKN